MPRRNPRDREKRARARRRMKRLRSGETAIDVRGRERTRPRR
jgi:hypothetical protein